MDKKTVSKIADLAKIQIEDNQIDNIVNNLEKILDLVNEMNSVDTHDIEPMSHPLNLKQELRVDEVTEKNLRETFQENSIASEVVSYNTKLATLVNDLTAELSITVHFIDAWSLFNDIVDNSRALGITNTQDSACSASATLLPLPICNSA